MTVSHSGYLKRTPISTYRQQRRGGTGRKGMSTREEDFVEQLFVASTHDYILVFTNKGRVYWLKVYEVPELSAAGKGKAIANLVSLQPGENGAGAGSPIRDLEEESRYVFFATRNGTVKKTPLKDFSNVRSHRHQCHRHRGRGRVSRGQLHRRQPDHLPRDPRWARQSASKRTRCGPWDASLRRARHEPGPRRLYCRHGGHPEGAQEGQGRARPSRT